MYPSRTSWTPIYGRSVNGNNIGLFSIDGEGTITRTLLMQCGIHAREWISPAVCQYLADYFLSDRGAAAIRASIQNTRLYIIPSVNPDGYLWSWTSSRLWRKNRKANGNCPGVDLNRNYRTLWGGGGSSGDPCSDTFRGLSAASEAETQVSENALRLSPPGGSGGVSGAVDMHSYSQLILRPYGNTQANSPDNTAHSTLGQTMRTEIQRRFNTQFTNQKSIDLYVTTGTFEGDAYGSSNPPTRCLGQTIELRPTGASPGFQLPPAQIVPSGQELEVAFNVWLSYFTTRNNNNRCGR